ncbi:MAG: hypothetical protein JNM63_05545 [Spirochaetia bacterium]|nr:hypothetical protein [Spirochaetia bacterium]
MKHAHFPVLQVFIFLAFLISDLWAGQHFALVYRCEDAFASIEVNGVGVMASKKDTFVSGRRFVNEWILPGTNEIAVRIQPAGLTQGEPAFSFEIYAVKSGRIAFIDTSIEEAKKVYSFKWPEGPSNTRSLNTNGIFFANEAPPSLLTAKGEVLKLTETERTNARAAVVALGGNVEKKNKNAFLALMGFQLAEKVRLRQDADPAFKKASEEMLLKMFDRLSGKNIKSKPDEWSFQLVMGGRLARVVEKSGKSPLDTEDSSFPIYLGKLDGQWVFAR